MNKKDILNKLADVMFDLTDFCESVAHKLKEASGHGIPTKETKVEDKEIDFPMNKPEVNEAGTFVIRSIKTGKYVVGLDKNGKKKLDPIPILNGNLSTMEGIFAEYKCDPKFYEIVEIPQK